MRDLIRKSWRESGGGGERKRRMWGEVYKDGSTPRTFLNLPRTDFASRQFSSVLICTSRVCVAPRNGVRKPAKYTARSPNAAAPTDLYFSTAQRYMCAE